MQGALCAGIGSAPGGSRWPQCTGEAELLPLAWQTHRPPKHFIVSTQRGFPTLIYSDCSFLPPPPFFFFISVPFCFSFFFGDGGGFGGCFLRVGLGDFLLFLVLSSLVLGSRG